MEAPCAFESKIAAANATGPLHPELAQHATTCAGCAEKLWFALLAAEQPSLPTAPSGLVYWRAQLRTRQEQFDRALRPTRIAETALPIALALVVLTGAALWGQPMVVAGAAVFLLVLAASVWITRLA